MPSILEQADQEIDAHGDLAGLVLLVPEDQWDAFVRQAGAPTSDDGSTASYRGVTFRRAPITAIVPEEGF
jgi:hypothetical protein